MLLLQQTIMRFTLLLMAIALGCSGSPPPPTAKPEHVDVNGPQLWVQVSGDGDPTVVFEAGGGDDSSVWSTIEPRIRVSGAVRTVRYDRAGLGKSAPSPGNYRIDDEATALRRVLDRFGIRGR